MSTIYMMEAANLFVGDHDPAKSKHLTLAELKLPDLQEIFADHHPGGARVAIEVSMGMQKLEPTFKLNGWDPDLISVFGLGSRVKHIFTAYGDIVNKRTGAHIEAKAVIEARLGRIAPDAFSRGDVQGHEYAMNEVTHYEIHFNGIEKLYWNFWTSAWRVDGVDQNSDTNQILRIS